MEAMTQSSRPSLPRQLSTKPTRPKFNEAQHESRQPLEIVARTRAKKPRMFLWLARRGGCPDMHVMEYKNNGAHGTHGAQCPFLEPEGRFLAHRSIWVTVRKVRARSAWENSRSFTRYSASMNNVPKKVGQIAWEHAAAPTSLLHGIRTRCRLMK